MPQFQPRIDFGLGQAPLFPRAGGMGQIGGPLPQPTVPLPNPVAQYLADLDARFNPEMAALQELPEEQQSQIQELGARLTEPVQGLELLQQQQAMEGAGGAMPAAEDEAGTGLTPEQFFQAQQILGQIQQAQEPEIDIAQDQFQPQFQPLAPQDVPPPAIPQPPQIPQQSLANVTTDSNASLALLATLANDLQDERGPEESPLDLRLQSVFGRREDPYRRFASLFSSRPGGAQV